MQQSKRHSLIETFVNVGLGIIMGFTISQLAHYYQHEIQHYIWKDFVWELSVKSNIVMTFVLTFFSLLRGYVCRRVFNKIQMRGVINDSKTSVVHRRRRKAYVEWHEFQTPRESRQR